jgi:hypothetical protein
MTAAKLWDDATGDIIARTRKQHEQKSAAPADVSFRYPKARLFVLNE